MDFADIVNFLDFGFAGLIAFYLVTKTTTAINNLTMTIQHQTSILIFIAGNIKGHKMHGIRKKTTYKMSKFILQLANI